MRAPESRKLVRQRDLAVERAQMHDAGAGLQRAKEIHRDDRANCRGTARPKRILAVAGAQERRGRVSTIASSSA
jgi:hypothetical protein